MHASNRSVAIDCLRGVAVLWVVEYHFYKLSIFHLGTYGVLLFFIISGYCISISMEGSKSAWHFYAKRLGRLLPALIVCGFITTAFKHIAPWLTEPNRLLPWWQYAYSIILLPTLSFFRVDSGFPDGAYWSLLVEFQFYFLCAAIMLIGLREHLIPILCVLVVFRTLTTSIADATPNDFLPFFIAGASVAALAEGRAREATIGFVVAIAVDLYHLYFHFPQPSVPIVLSRTITLWGGTLGVYLASRLHVPAKLAPLLLPLSLVGLISYPLYLIHQDVGAMILALLYPGGAPVYAETILVPAALITVSWLIYFFVERNAIKPLTSFLAGERLGAPAPL
ncbi:MAG TPA: acyltransferase [Bradyrhizobium sp.]|nr:acyltransferase [Bradyrhizobium sp.]